MRYAVFAFLLSGCFGSFDDDLEMCEREARIARRTQTYEEAMRVYEDCLYREGLK